MAGDASNTQYDLLLTRLYRRTPAAEQLLTKGARRLDMVGWQAVVGVVRGDVLGGQQDDLAFDGAQVDVPAAPAAWAAHSIFTMRDDGSGAGGSGGGPPSHAACSQPSQW